MDRPIARGIHFGLRVGAGAEKIGTGLGSPER